MEKRVIAVFTSFCLIIGCLCLRLYVLSSSGTEMVSSEAHYSSFKLSETRGDIVDCKGRRLTQTEYDNYVIAKPDTASLSALSEILDSVSYSDVRKRMEKGLPVMINIGKRTLSSSDSVLCVPVFRRYSTAQSAQHILGYLDGEGHGISGIEKAFDDILFSGDCLTARVPIDAYGRSIIGGKIEFSGGTADMGTVKLTIDSDIQSAVEAALDEGGITEGYAIVVDVASGAVRACASRPSFDAYRIVDSLDSQSSPLLDRAMQSFAVGSVFKVAVAAAALQSGNESFEYTCTGSCNIGSVKFGCSSHTAHGKVGLKEALEKSCNTYFINLGQKIGAEKLSETANLLGFGQKTVFAKNLTADSGVLPSADELTNPAALANFSFGQGSFTASPFQIAQMFCAVADRGRYHEPYLVESVTDKSGNTEQHKKKYPVVAMDEATSLRLTQLLTSVVENGNASPAKPDRFSAAGKTATAQTGIFDKSGNEICNTWFGGFFPAESPRYAVVVMKQGGASGSYDCAPVFKKIADTIKISE